jgi:hypothetical protein
MTSVGRPRTPPEARFWAKVNKTDTCWLWTGAIHNGGAGIISVNGKPVSAHYFLMGKPPEGMVWKHTCNVKHCVNPEHLHPGKTGVPAGPAEDRFWAKVNKTDTCWLWTGALGGAGYGVFSFERTLIRAHQFLAGKAPDGMVWDHLCQVRTCVRPDHLEAVTQSENARRGWARRKGRSLNH